MSSWRQISHRSTIGDSAGLGRGWYRPGKFADNTRSKRTAGCSTAGTAGAAGSSALSMPIPGMMTMPTCNAERRVVFPKKPTRTVSDTAIVWSWTARSGDWRVQRRVSRFKLPETWLVLKFDERFGVFDIISRHRRRKPAFRAVEQHASGN